MIFITHQIPKGLQVDEVFTFGGRQNATKLGIVDEDVGR
jgi:subfamily B ATP-binding cassette protein HlyB/CyaB